MFKNFITFEGIDGSGKTTQIHLLSEHLKKNGVEFVFTREPGGSSIGAEIRNLLLSDSGSKLTTDTQVMLLMADRMQHLEEKILPAIRAKKLVLCDRYFDSTLIYQEGAEGLDLRWIRSFFAEKGKQPDLTFFLKISPELAIARLNSKNNSKTLNHFDKRSLSFFQKLDEKYRLLISEDSAGRFRTIEAGDGKEKIHRQILDVLIREKILNVI